MSPVKLAWTKLTPKPDPSHGVPCARSSHCVSLLKRDDKNVLFVYGGEHVARTPLGKNDVSWLYDDSDSSWKWIDSSSSQSPPDRIAHAQAVYDNRYVYIFGGRAGITMQEKAMNDLWVFDIEAETWKEVEGKGNLPEARSFHRMICIGSDLYVFGGCGSVSGRLNDLHKFDVKTETWQNLGSSQLRGRGGPNVFPIDSSKKIAVVAGFAGEETKDGHVFDLASGKWSDNMLAAELEGMRPRSVCISASFPSAGVTVIFGGEVDPSDRGHEGAGGFENDIVILDEKTAAYKETIKADDKSPEQRGWSDAGAVDLGNGKGQLFVFGGLSGDDTSPRRLDDLWKLEIEA